MDAEFKNKFIELIDDENIKRDLRRIEDDSDFIESISLEFRKESIPLIEIFKNLFLDTNGYQALFSALSNFSALFIQSDKEKLPEDQMKIVEKLPEDQLNVLNNMLNIFSNLSEDQLRVVGKFNEKQQLIFELSKQAISALDRSIAFACFLFFTDSLTNPATNALWTEWLKNSAEKYGEDAKLKYLYGVPLNYAEMINAQNQNGDPQVIMLNAFRQNPMGILSILNSYINIRKILIIDYPEAFTASYELYKNMFKNVSRESYSKVLISIDLSSISEYYFVAGSVQEATKLINESLFYWPDNAYSNCILGNIYLSKGEYTDAIDILLKAEKLAEDQFDGIALKNIIYINIFIGISYAYYKSGSLENALKYYDKALILKPAPLFQAIILNNRGRTLLEKNEMDKANEDFNQALILLSNLGFEGKEIESSIRNNLAIIYYKRGLIDKAKSECELAISISPKLAEAYNTLGVIYNEDGNQKIAERLLKTAIGINPLFRIAEKNISDLNTVYGLDWYDWWFGKNASSERKLIGISLISILSIDIISSHWMLYVGKDLPNNFMIMVGLIVAILLVPYIKKVSLGGVELELESKGQSMPPSLTLL